MTKSQISPTSTISYAGVFDHSIYEQEDVNGATEQEINDAKIRQLLIKKNARLEKVIIERCDSRLEHLKEVINTGTLAWDLVRTGVSILPSLFSDDGIGMARAARVVTKEIDESVREVAREEAKKQYFELLFQKRLLRDGLEKEPIFDLEKKYVVRKGRIKSKELKDQIEKCLLLSREEGVYVEFLRKFIDNALNLPTKHLEINVQKAENLKNKPFFQHFHPALQQELAMMAVKLATDSKLDRSSTSKRSIYYLHGNPSTGKSSAIREMAEHLGLPCFIPVVRTSADLSSTQLEGARRTMMTHSPGFLAEALLAKNEEGESYTNGILVIDDFDRILLDSSSGKEIPVALTFLLNYLEPEKVDYFNPYFESEIDISRLSIVITANRPIPALVAGQKIDQDPYAALRSRVRQIYFPDFNVEKVQEMLTDYNQEVGEKYELSQQTMAIVFNEAIRHESRLGRLEPRSLKRRIETIALRAKSNLSLTPDETIEGSPTRKTPEEDIARPNCCLYMYQRVSKLVFSVKPLPTLTAGAVAAVGAAAGAALTMYTMQK